ncbi:MAG: GNAT family N-acetyltransferase [Rhizobiaceae bacterium]
MTDSRIVRTALAEDFEQAMRLYSELAGDSQIDLGPDGRQLWHDVLAHPGTSVYCVEQAGQIAAVTTLHVLPNTTYKGRPYALIENVVTLRRFHKQGAGRLLMEHVIDEAWQQDCYKIMLLTGQLAGARGFYERLGFSADEKYGMTLRRIPVRQKTR